jgi:hypothetical protein
MAQSVSLPVPIYNIVSITSTLSPNYFKICISGTFGYKNIPWNVEGIKPITTENGPGVYNEELGGSSIILYFRKKSLMNLHLYIGTVQRNYTGPNIVDYLQTELTGFGQIIEESSSSNSILGFGIIAGLSIILSLILADAHGNKRR